MAIGLIIAACIGVAVGKDASKRGMNGGAWGIGVFLLLIVFLPLYFIMRKPLLAPAYGAYPHPGHPQPGYAQPGYPQGAHGAHGLPPAPAPQPMPGAGNVYPPGTAVMITAVDGQRYPGTVNQFQNGQYLCVFANGTQNWYQAHSVGI